MRAPLKAVARTVSASISSAFFIRCHLKVLLFRLRLSMVHRLVLHVVPIPKETTAHNSVDTHGMENHQCSMGLMGSL
jgi:hypothetical protein